jgi:hypothetical protein
MVVKVVEVCLGPLGLLSSTVIVDYISVFSHPDREHERLFEAAVLILC